MQMIQSEFIESNIANRQLPDSYFDGVGVIRVGPIESIV